MLILYVHSLMSYEDLRATINPHTNRRSRKIKTILNIYKQETFGITKGFEVKGRFCMISTSKQHAGHPFSGRNTQHMGL